MDKKKKRLIAVITAILCIALIVALSIVGCNRNSKDSGKKAKKDSTSASAKNKDKKDDSSEDAGDENGENASGEDLTDTGFDLSDGDDFIFPQDEEDWDFSGNGGQDEEQEGEDEDEPETFYLVPKKTAEAKISLKKGINVSTLQDAEAQAFVYEPGTYTLIKNSGFDHVRLPINWMGRLEDVTASTKLDQYYMRECDRAINAALDAGLAVIIDFHGMSDSVCADVGKYEQAFYDMWEQLAIRYQKYSDNLYFELINEPSNRGTEDTMTNARLNQLQRNAIKIIRKYCPTRPILFAVNQWNGVYNMHTADMPTVAEDPNLVLTVHMYQPMNFTHQGAWWDPAYEHVLEQPFTDGTRAAIENDFKTIDAWRKSHDGREVYIGEFGVNRGSVHSEDAHAYTACFSELADQYDVGWGYWEMANSFGLYNFNTEQWLEDTYGGLFH